MTIIFPNLQHPELLTPPVARAAYSNRASWIMAHMSRMAYYKFEGDPDLVTALAESLAAKHKPDAAYIKKEIDKFLVSYSQTPPPGRQALEKELGLAGFKVVETFSRGHTQAFLATREPEKLAVLAFRGTEKDHGDIKTDLNFRFYKKGGVGVHNGFQMAFQEVEEDIKAAYRNLSDYKVYITGHSLGGALAIVATRSLDFDKDIPTDNLASCYTFGSPKVGTMGVGEGLRTPVYRVVNDADAVPRLPPSFLFDLLDVLVRVTGAFYLKGLLRNFSGYRHVGDMRFLTATHDETHADVRLILNPDLTDRIIWLAQSLFSDFKASYERHSINEYCAKLEAYALK